MARKKFKNIYQTEDGRWYYSKMIRGHRYVKYFSTANEAYDELRKLTYLMLKNGNKDMSFPMFIEDYKSYMATKYEITTCISKEYSINKHILPFFKDMYISEINQFVVKQWRYNFIMNNTQLSASHKNHIINLCKLIMKYLQDIYYYPTGFEHLVYVKNKEIIEEKTCWSYDEYNKFNNVIKDPIDRLAFHLMFYYGLRLGELLGLQWKCIYFEKNILKIVQQRVNDRQSHQQILKSPKTTTSVRSIYITNITKNMLLDLKGKKDDFIINVSRTTLRRRFNYYQDLSQVERITIHQLRHSCITNMYYSNYDIKAVGNMVGHSNQKMTFHYTHKNNIAVKNLVETLEKNMCKK